jgi:peptidyl-prolyl cis-trans isomerase SurA
MSGVNWKTLVNNDPSHFQADSGRFELAQLSESDRATAGYYSNTVVNTDGTASFVKYLHIYEANQQRSFEDAKGMLINDYQTVLEKKWLEQLRKKYPVKINEAILQGIIKSL